MKATSEERDINKWRYRIRQWVRNSPEHVQYVRIRLERTPFEAKIFETPIPRLEGPFATGSGPRYAGAWINNAVMTWGCRRLFISADVFEPLRAVLQARYSQIEKAIRENYGVDNGMGPLDESLAPSSARSIQRYLCNAEELKKRAIAGVDIGNTSTKVVVVENDKLVMRDRFPTFPGGDISFSTLQKTVALARAKIRKTQKNVASLGIGWFGDVREGKPLLQAAALERIASVVGEEKIVDFLRAVVLRDTTPTRLFGDTEALGTALPFMWPEPKLYLMVVGTSVGGIYLDENTTYETSFGLLSRVVVDLSEDAPSHASTGVKGTLQQYVAARGILRAFGILPNSVRKRLLQGRTPNVQNAGILLRSGLESGDQELRNASLAVVEEMSRWLAAGIMAILPYYEIDKFGITGTSMQGAVGRVFVQKTREALLREYDQRDIRIELSPFDCTYGVAIGAAYSAAMHVL